MDSNDSGPPPSKRFMNGNREGQVRHSESDSRGGHPGRGIRGRGFSRGRGGGFRGRFRGPSEQDSGADGSGSFGSRGRGIPFRGRGSSPFRGRGRSTSLSSPDDHTPGFRGGRGSFHSRGSFSGFWGRGGSPGFRGRGFAPGRRGAPVFRGRGAGSLRPEFQHDPMYKNTIHIHNLRLPSSKSFFEQREFVRGVLAEYKCVKVDLDSHAGHTKAICLFKDQDAVKRACKDLNGRFVENCQILVSGVGSHNPLNIPIVIKNFPESSMIGDLVGVLHDCKAISRIGRMNTTVSPPHVIVFVDDEDDVTRIMDKSSSKVKGSKIEIKRLDSNFVARSLDNVVYGKWDEVLGSDIPHYFNKTYEFTDIYFESCADLEAALKKVEEYNKSNKEKIDCQRRYLHEFFYAEVCDVEGEVNDAELYSLVRKHGEISEFRRLDKDYYMIKQELSAALGAMSLSDSKGCGGTLKFSWLDTRVSKNPGAQENKEKKKKKKKKKNADEKEIETNDAVSTEEAGGQTSSSIEAEKASQDEEMDADDNSDDEDEEVDEDEEEDEEDDEEDEEDDEEDEGDDEEDEEDSEEELEDESVDKEESDDDEQPESHEVPVAKKTSKKNKSVTSQVTVPQNLSNVRQNRRPKKRKISSSA